jgi:hypothetical protein
MNQLEKISSESPDRNIEEKRNVVHKFYSDVFPEIKVIVDASELCENDKGLIVDFYKEFLGELEDESYIERVMVSTGPLILSPGEISQLRRIKLEDGTYSLENSLYVFKEFFGQEFGRVSGEKREVFNAILSALEEALNKQN